jgi:hypothetical protein
MAIDSSSNQTYVQSNLADKKELTKYKKDTNRRTKELGGNKEALDPCGKVRDDQKVELNGM